MSKRPSVYKDIIKTFIVFIKDLDVYKDLLQNASKYEGKKRKIGAAKIAMDESLNASVILFQPINCRWIQCPYIYKHYI